MPDVFGLALPAFLLEWHTLIRTAVQAGFHPNCVAIALPLPVSVLVAARCLGADGPTRSTP